MLFFDVWPENARVNKNLRGNKVQCGVSKKYEKRESEPWLIVSSLSSSHYPAKEIIRIYKKRMQIEEAFRDLKNTKNGLSLRHSRTFRLERFQIILLITTIAMFLLWIICLMAKKKNIHYRFQANTVKTRNVLSTFMIGWQYLKRYGDSFLTKEFFNILAEIPTHALS